MAFKRNKVYPVLSIERGWYKIPTELDEDYLFHPSMFQVVEGSVEDVPVVCGCWRPAAEKGRC